VVDLHISVSERDASTQISSQTTSFEKFNEKVHETDKCPPWVLFPLFQTFWLQWFLEGTRPMNFTKPDAAINIFLAFMLTVCVNYFLSATLWRSKHSNEIEFQHNMNDGTVVLQVSSIGKEEVGVNRPRTGLMSRIQIGSWPMQLRIGDAWQILCLKARPSLEYWQQTEC